MSLHQLAQHMQSAGRGDDKMLVHMTPGEVHGLQKLALAHGGSLTINPETGLPEAGFLSSLLPTLLGAGLTIASGGALSPLMAAGLVGGGTALATGSLEKGLMAGLGAYGGAGLGAGLGSLGGAAAGASAGTAAAGSSAAGLNAAAANSMIGQTMAPVTGAATGAASGAVGTIPGINTAGGFTGYTPATLGQNTMPLQVRGAAQRLLQPEVLNSGVPGSVSTAVTPAEVMSVAPPETAIRSLSAPPPAAMQMAPSQMPVDATTIQPFRTPSPYTAPTPGDATSAQLFKDYTGGPSLPSLPSVEDRSGVQNIIRNVADTPDTSSSAMRGLKQATSSWQGLKDLYGEMEKKAPYSGMAAGYSLLSGMNERPKPPKGTKSLIRPYTLKRNRVVDSDVGPSSSAERRYFNDVYTAGTPYEAPGPEYKAAGGIVALAAGGYMDNINAQNPVDIDSGNQFAAQQQHAYPSMQAPSPLQNTFAESNNMMMPQEFANGGIASFADGGELPQYEYLGNNQYELRNPVATTTAPKLSPTGQTLDASGGYYGPYGQYFNAAGQPQMWYMDPANANDPEAIKSAKAAGITLKAPTTTAASAPVTTQEGLEALYQKNFGRAADASGIESYLGKGYTPEQITEFMQSSEEYKPIKERLDEEAKQATYADPTQIANIYSDVLGRTPDMGGLDYYSGQNLTPEQVEQQLMQSEEYRTNLTKPFVPAISYSPTGQATIEGAPEYQTPEQQLGLAPTTRLDSTPDFYGMMDAELRKQGGYANGGDVQGYNLGGYSDGGRLLRGPGDGVSDDIPATIGARQPARLADGEFVIPARIVSELGNGSTEAGAKRLYAMMDRVQKARGKTVGKGKVAVNSKADKHLPA